MSESFSTDWLALRANADRRARSLGLEQAAAQWATAQNEPLRIVDLGSGTGNNLRHLAPRLGITQHWTLCERDPVLAAEAQRRGRPATVTDVSHFPLDLNDAPALANVLADADLVTCSALLDLVSADWVDGFTHCLADRRLPLLAVLTYDGRMRFHPAHQADIGVRDLVNQHQRRDKGFGPALGPTATEYVSGRLSQRGYTVATEASDWQLDGSDRDVVEVLIDGYAGAAIDMAPDQEPGLGRWCQNRRGVTEIRVGHLDLWALPGGIN